MRLPVTVSNGLNARQSKTKQFYGIHKFAKFVESQAAQTLFVIYIRDSIALCLDPFIKRMYENGLKIALNSTCSKGFK